MINKNLVNKINQDKGIVDKERLKFLTILETSPDLILVTRLSDGKIELLNKGFLDSVGYTHDEIEGKTTRELNLWERDESRDKFIMDLKRDNKLSNYENLFIKKDGSRFLGSNNKPRISYFWE